MIAWVSSTIARFYDCDHGRASELGAFAGVGLLQLSRLLPRRFPWREEAPSCHAQPLAASPAVPASP